MAAVLAPEGRLVMRSSRAPLTWRVRNLRHRLRGSWRRALVRLFGVGHWESALYLRLLTPEGVTDYGLVGRRVVTSAFVNYAVDALQGDQAFENFKYHGFGTGTNAEAISDTGLQIELTTQYPTDDTRPTGTQLEGATANIYRTVGTLDPDTAVAITEHGIFLAATGATTLMDRTVFSVINVAATGDTLEATYELSFVAGS